MDLGDTQVWQGGAHGRTAATTFRHTPEHDAWTPDGRCDALIQEPDGNVTRCGYVRDVAPLDLASDLAQLQEPVQRNAGARIAVAVLMGVLGVAIALDWFAFVLFVARNEPDPNMATAFIFRVAASGLYGAAVVWLLRRR